MVIGEITKTGGATGYPSVVYTWGPDGLVSERLDPTAVNGSPKSLWYHYGPQGETRQLTDSGGVITDWYVYDAYGMPVATSSPDANPFRFGGQYGYYTLPTLNVICCGARWYDPQMGRWFSRDPIDYEGGENLYSYCDGDPVGCSDADGLQSDARIISKETYDRRWRIITEGTYQRERSQYLRARVERFVGDFDRKADWASAVPVAGPVNAARRVGLLSRIGGFVKGLFSRGGAGGCKIVRGTEDIDSLAHYIWKAPTGAKYDLMLEAKVAGKSLVIEGAHLMPHGNADWAEARNLLNYRGLSQLGRDLGEFFDVDTIEIPRRIGRTTGRSRGFGPSSFKVR